MRLFATMLLLGFVGVFCTARTAADAADSPLDFDRDIAPVLARRCLDCHSGIDSKGKLDLSRKDRALAGTPDGAVIVPGKPIDSVLWQVVEAGEMPPKKPLPEAERKLLRRWIESGAAWGTDPIDLMARTTDHRAGGDWWSLQPVRTPTPPTTSAKSWVRNPIDAFVQAKLEAAGLRPSPEADRRLLLRRVTFDLTGLSPTPEEYDAFLSDTAPDAYEKVVDRLLASPQYGVRWARHWLDVARFGESNGFEYDEFRPDAWRYRDWVVDALNRDLPYDQFAKQQIAGDVLDPLDAGGLSATGFLVAGPFDTPGQNQQSAAMKAVVRQDELEDVVGTTAQAFLGLSVQCARCHDHKFDPVRQEEYYQLSASLAGVRHGVRDLPLSPEQTAAARARVEKNEAALEAIESPVRAKLKADRDRPAEEPLSPTWAWDFRRGGGAITGTVPARLFGKAEFTADGLKLDGVGAYAAAGPLPRTLASKTLEAWVRVANAEQRGGGVVSVQSPGGATFDAIVFGERDARQWTVGSDHFRRTQPLNAAPEADAARGMVHVVFTWAGDGTVTAYRNGSPYGQPYKPMTPPLTLDEPIVLFGARHEPATGNRLLSGTIREAAVYERALTPAEVRAAYRAGSAGITDADLDAALDETRRARRADLRRQIDADLIALSGTAGKAYAVAPRKPDRTFLLARGNPASPQAELPPGGLRAIAGVSADFSLAIDASDAVRRAALARWIASPDNPLFTRTIVNRLWHHHFGVGLVATPNDLGFNGGRPSHPELLDYLAAELVERKFSLKAMHRLMVTSATYRQSSSHNAAAAAIDADNRLLWRKTPLRLEAEAVRDAALLLAGELDLSLGGVSFREPAKAGRFAQTGRHTPPPTAAAPFTRRTLYRAWTRGNRNGLLDALDCPDPSATAPARAVTNTPVQALALLNNAAMLQSAEGFARRVESAGGSTADRVRLAYRLAYGRPPDEHEAAAAAKAVDAHGLLALTRAILNSNEFLFLE